MQTSATGTGQRRQSDRRRVTWRTLVRGCVSPRRRASRRDEDGEVLIDWHEPQLMVFALTILALSVLDAMLTLTLIARGAATEANPILAFLLDNHPEYFALVKMLLTGAGVIGLVAVARARAFGVIRVRHFINACMLGYVVLIGYELWLLRVTI